MASVQTCITIILSSTPDCCIQCFMNLFNAGSDEKGVWGLLIAF